MPPLKGTLLRHTAANLTGLGAATLVQAVLGAFLVRDLGLQGYGTYALLAALVLHFLLFAEPLGAWVTRAVARGHRRLPLDAALGLWLGLSLPLGAAVLGLGFFGLQRYSASERALVLTLAAPGFFLAQIASFYQAVLAGAEAFGRLRAVQAAGPCLRLLGVLALRPFLPPEARLSAYALLFLGTVAAQTVALLLCARPLLGRLPRPSFAPPLWRRILRFGAPLFSMKLAALAGRRLDLWLVATLVGPKAVGLYGIALLFQGLTEQVTEAVRAYILPVGTRLRRALGPLRAEDFLLRATALCTFLTALAATTLALPLRELLPLLFGPGAEGAALPARLLLAAQVLASLRAVGLGLAMARGQTRALAPPFLQASAVNFLTGLLGTRWLGVAGPALGSLVGAVLLLSWQGRRIRRLLRVSATAWDRSLTRIALAWGGGMAGAGCALLVLPLPGATLVYVALHAVLFAALSLTPADRRFLSRTVRVLRGGAS